MKLKYEKWFRMNRYIGLTLYNSDNLWFNNNTWILEWRDNTHCQSSHSHKYQTYKWMRRFIKRYGNQLPKWTKVILCAKFIGQANLTFII